MSNRYSDRVLALAGLAQALHQVRRIAETGQSESSAVQASLESVFRIEAATPLAVYGRLGDVTPGLRVLRSYLAKEAQDDGLPRLAMAVLQLERRFVREDDTVHAVTRGLADIAPRAEQHGSTHPDVLSALGGLYADTISHLRPRVMVQGNPHYLGQPGVVSEIRALLLAAVRSAMLWRQLGGNQWQFLFARGAMGQALQGWLKPLIPLRDGLSIVLRLLRASGTAENQLAKGGSFQLMLGGSTSQMVRVSLKDSLSFVPEISANKYALNIRFIRQDLEARSRQPDAALDVPFEIVFCNL